MSIAIDGKADPLRETWVLIGRLEERTRAVRVVASWKDYCAHHAPGSHELQAILSKVALEILCSTEEETTE